MQIRTKILFCVLSLMLLTQLTGCIAIVAGGAAGYVVASHKQSVGNYTSDSVITSKIKTKYLADSQIKSLNLSVSTTKGIVSLSGNVPNQTMKNHAIKIAKSTNGVRGINAGNLIIG